MFDYVDIIIRKKRIVKIPKYISIISSYKEIINHMPKLQNDEIRYNLTNPTMFKLN